MHELKYYVEHEDKFDHSTQDFMIVDVDELTIENTSESSIKLRYKLRSDLLTQNMAIMDTNDEKSLYIISPNYPDSYFIVGGFDADEEVYDSLYTSQYEGLMDRSKSLLLLQFLVTSYNLLDENIDVMLEDNVYIYPTFLEHDTPLNLQYRYKNDYLIVRTNAYLNLDGVYKIGRGNRNSIRDIFISVLIFLYTIERIYLLESQNKTFQSILTEMKDFMNSSDMDSIYLLPINYIQNIYLYEYKSGNIEDFLTKESLKDILSEIIDGIVAENKIVKNVKNLEIRRYDIPL